MKSKLFLCAALLLPLTLQSACAQVIIGGGGGGSGGGSGTVTSVATGACLTGGPITTTGTIAATSILDAQTGTSYTVPSSDACAIATSNNASAVAWTLPQATGRFAAGWSFDVWNRGAGLLTITPTTSTVNGAATLAVRQNSGCSITSDGTNYQVSSCTALSGGTIASGTAAMSTSAIASGSCATVVTVTATGVATTDTLLASFNGDPTGVTGFAPATTGMLTIIGYPTTNNANFKECNNTSASITPGAHTLNWRVAR
jgi:hypothetical protein